MSLYYLLLVFARFHNDPRVSQQLFDAALVMVTPVKVVGLVTVVAALVLPHPKNETPRLRNWIMLLWLAFCFFQVIGTLAFRLSLPRASLSSLVSLTLLLVATRLLVTTEDRMRKVVRVMTVVSAFASFWLYKQYFLGHVVRPGGVEQDPNYEALTLVTGISLAVWMAYHESNKWWRRVGLGCAILMGGGVLITESRGGLIGAAAVAIGAVVVARHRLVTIALVAAICGLVVALMPRGLATRFGDMTVSGPITNGDEGSSRIHYALVMAGLSMIEQHPMFGVGLEEFKRVAPDYNPAIYGLADRSYVAHNTYVQIAAESGVPALLAFLMLLVVACRNVGAGRKGKERALADLGTAMRLGIVGFAVASASVTAEYVVSLWLLIFLSQNLAEIAEGAKREEKVRGIGELLRLSTVAISAGTKSASNLESARTPELKDASQGRR